MYYSDRYYGESQTYQYNGSRDVRYGQARQSEYEESYGDYYTRSQRPTQDSQQQRTHEPTVSKINKVDLSTHQEKDGQYDEDEVLKLLVCYVDSWSGIIEKLSIILENDYVKTIHPGKKLLKSYLSGVRLPLRCIVEVIKDAEVIKTEAEAYITNHYQNKERNFIELLQPLLESIFQKSNSSQGYSEQEMENLLDPYQQSMLGSDENQYVRENDQHLSDKHGDNTIIFNQPQLLQMSDSDEDTGDDEEAELLLIEQDVTPIGPKTLIDFLMDDETIVTWKTVELKTFSSLGLAMQYHFAYHPPVKKIIKWPPRRR